MYGFQAIRKLISRAISQASSRAVSGSAVKIALNFVWSRKPARA